MSYCVSVVLLAVLRLSHLVSVPLFVLCYLYLEVVCDGFRECVGGGGAVRAAVIGAEHVGPSFTSFTLVHSRVLRRQDRRGQQRVVTKHAGGFDVMGLGRATAGATARAVAHIGPLSRPRGQQLFIGHVATVLPSNIIVLRSGRICAPGIFIAAESRVRAL